MKVLLSPAVSLVILCGILPETWGQTATDAKNLRQKIFVTDKYDKKIRPTISHVDPTEVYVDFHLLSINNLDEVTETLKTTGYLVIEWNDHFLTWNASDYNGIEYYHWPQDDVWKPDVALKNSFLEYKQLGVSTLNVVVHADGTVYWSPFQHPNCYLSPPDILQRKRTVAKRIRTVATYSCGSPPCYGARDYYVSYVFDLSQERLLEEPNITSTFVPNQNGALLYHTWMSTDMSLDYYD